MSDFDPNWPHGHVTRGGLKARIICTDRDGVAPIVALVRLGGAEQLATFTKQGWSYSGEGPDDARNLVNAPAPKRFSYVNFYAGGAGLSKDRLWTSSESYPSRAAADEAAGRYNPDRIACIKITEGQFDE